MSLQCEKCQKIFKYEYHLNSHINKSISCDVILQCEICKKIFTLEKDLSRHHERKNPCKPPSEVPNIKILLEIEKEKTKRIEIENQIKETSKINILKEANALDLKIKQEVTKRVNNQIQSKKEAEYAKTSRMELSKKYQMDLEQVRLKARLEVLAITTAHAKEIEKEKTKRKEYNSLLAKYNAEIEIKNRDDKLHTIAINKITKEFLDINEVDYMSFPSEVSITEYIQDSFVYKPIFKEFFKSYIEHKSVEQLIKDILYFYFNNPKYPKYRFIFYTKELKFYTITRYDNNIDKTVINISFIEKILPLIIRILCNFRSKFSSWLSNYIIKRNLDYNIYYINNMNKFNEYEFDIHKFQIELMCKEICAYSLE